MTVRIHDTHFHLDLVDDMAGAIEEIEEFKIYTIAVTNLPNLFSRLQNRIDSKYIRPALGFHPELLYQYKEQIPRMWSLLSETRYIGEVGLDFKKVDAYSRSLQISFFQDLIWRCHDLGNKILTVHSRGSSKELVSMIQNDFNGKIILHWYSGDKETLKEALDKGFYFSVNYSMVKSNSGRSIISMLPSDRILLESDSPFVKIDSKQFNPFDTYYILDELANFLKIDRNKMSDILWDNLGSLVK